MQLSVAKKSFLNLVLCLGVGAVLIACGGTESSNSTASTAKLLANGEACTAPWSSTKIYVAGNKASYANRNYTAAYWTQNNNPSTNNGGSGSGKPWIPGFGCGGTTTSTTTTTTKPVVITTTTTTTTTTTLPVPCSPYVAGAAYTVGKIVSNAGGYYSCTVAGWCSSGASAYAPGVGSAWTSAWSAVNASACTPIIKPVITMGQVVIEDSRLFLGWHTNTFTDRSRRTIWNVLLDNVAITHNLPVHHTLPEYDCLPSQAVCNSLEDGSASILRNDTPLPVGKHTVFVRACDGIKCIDSQSATVDILPRVTAP